MRRSDRLFQITQYLRARKLTTARQLADWLAVSERTVYRDIRDLSLSGVPVEGEAGVGYRIKAGHDLPPLMFKADEIDALVIGMRMVQAWGGTPLSDAATAALAKVLLALPHDQRDFVETMPRLVSGPPPAGQSCALLEQVRQAIAGRHKLLLHHADGQHLVWPLALAFCSGNWILAAWCELREDFHSQPLDQVCRIDCQGHYPDRNGRRLADFVRAMRGDPPARLA